MEIRTDGEARICILQAVEVYGESPGPGLVKLLAIDEFGDRAEVTLSLLDLADLINDARLDVHVDGVPQAITWNPQANVLAIYTKIDQLSTEAVKNDPDQGKEMAGDDEYKQLLQARAQELLDHFEGYRAQLGDKSEFEAFRDWVISRVASLELLAEGAQQAAQGLAQRIDELSQWH